MRKPVSEKCHLRNPTKNELKRLQVWVWLFLIASIIGGILAIKQRVYWHVGAKPPSRSHLYANALDTTIHVRINGQDLDIPRSYFRSRIPQDGEETEGVVLSAMYFDFGPLTDSESSLWKKGQANKVIDIFPQNPTRLNEFQRMLVGSMKHSLATEYKADLYGLKVYVGIKETKGEARTYYVEGSVENPVSFISCTSEKLASNPQCEHRYEYGYLHVQLDYAKELLPEWKIIKEKSTNLIASFYR